MAEKVQTDFNEDYQINDDDIFKCISEFYLESLQTHAEKKNVKLRTYELDYEKGIEVRGKEQDVKSILDFVKGTVGCIKVEHKQYNDLGYFYPSDGQEKRKKLEQKHRVKLKIETGDRGDGLCSITSTSYQNSDGPSYRWKFLKGHQLILTYGRGVETGADVVTQAFETDKPVWKQDFKTENKDGALIVQFPVPSKPEQKSNLMTSLSNLFKQFPSERCRTIVVEVDTCTSWKLKNFSKCLVTCFVEYIQSVGSPRGLKLYMCVTQGETKPQPLKTCNCVLEDMNQSFDFIQIDKQLKEKNRTIKIELCKGDITKIQADVIVNTVSHDLDLNKGIASKALSEAAGPGLQKEIDEKNPQSLNFGKIAVTNGHWLPCDFVLHGCLEKYDEKTCGGYKSEDDFYKVSVHVFLMNCLKKAAKLDCQIISFPVIGTGSLYYPTYLVAKQMFETLPDLDPEVRPELVKIVVFHRDEDAYKVFEDEHKKFEMKQASELIQKSNARRRCDLLKIVGSDKDIQSVKEEISSLVQESNESTKSNKEDQPELKLGQRLKVDSQYDKTTSSQDVFTPKSASRSQKNLHKSRRGDSSSVSSDTPPASPSSDDGYMGTGSFVTSKSVSDKTGGYGTDARSFMSNKTDSDNIGREIDVLGPKQNLLKSAMTQNRLGNVTDITNGGCPISTQPQELLKCTENEFELLVYFHPECIEKYKTTGCLLDYSENHSSIVVYGEIPTTQGIRGLRLDLTNTMKKIRSLQSDSVDITNMELRNVRKCVNDLMTNHVHLIVNDKSNQVNIYCERYADVVDTAHQLKVRLGKVKETNRQERQIKSTYFGQMDENQKRQTHIGNGDHKLYSPRDNNTPTGAKPKTGQRPFSWSTNTKYLEMFDIDNKIEVRVYQGSILHAPVDCIVNAANRDLQHGGGVARVISQAAGRDLDMEGWKYIRTYGYLNVGDVCVTTAGDLNYVCVIHAVGPNWSEYKPYKMADVKRCEKDLHRAISKSLETAERRGLKSIAFPGISAGIYACPWELCFVQYARAIMDYSKKHSTNKMVQEIHFVDTNEELVKQVQYTFKAMLIGKRMPNSYDLDRIVAKAKRGYSGQIWDKDTRTRDPRGQAGQHGSVPHSGKDMQSTDTQGRGGQPGSAPNSVNDKRKSNPAPKKPGQSTANKQQSAKLDNDACCPYVSRKCPPGLSTAEFVCVISPKQKMFVYVGAITDNLTDMDMIACGEKVEGSGAGKVAQHFEKYLGQDYVKKKKDKFKYAREGDVVIVNCPLKDLHVAHVIMHQKTPGLDEKTRRLKVVGTYEKLFTEAMKLKCKEIALPLIGSGKGGVPIAEATERLCEGLRQFASSSQNYEMTIHLVNSDKEKIKQLIDIIEKLVNHLKKSVPSQVAGQNKNMTSGTPRRNRNNISQSSANTRKSSPQNHQQQNEDHQGLKPTKTHEFHISAGSKQTKDKYFESDEEQEDKFEDHKEYYQKDNEEEESDEECDSEDQGLEVGAPVNTNEGESNECVICMENLKKPKRLPCGHRFCSNCIEQQFVYKEACPVCGRVCGTITGDQPDGTMKVNKSKEQCAGYEKFGRIEIIYHFPNGKQGPDHPSPGKWYKGFTRVAYLPDNRKGKQVLEMLRVAFNRKLVFTIGNSRTTGQEGVITWNDIHHKTDPKPHTQFGYPDHDYLDRVTDELAAKGVTESDI